MVLLALVEQVVRGHRERMGILAHSVVAVVAVELVAVVELVAQQAALVAMAEQADAAVTGR